MPGAEGEGQKPPQTAEEARRQTESRYSQLMDQMEASIPTNGEFFWTIGQKPTDVKTTDNRALILKEGTQRTEDTNFSDRKKGTFDFVVITRRGIRIVNLTPSDKDEFVWMAENSSEIDRFDQGTGGRKDVLLITPKGSSGLPMTYSLREIVDDKDDALVNNSMSESIRVAKETSAKVKEKAALADELQKLAKAEELSNFFAKFTKPSASGTSSPAGSPPPPPSPAT